MPRTEVKGTPVPLKFKLETLSEVIEGEESVKFPENEDNAEDRDDRRKNRFARSLENGVGGKGSGWPVEGHYQMEKRYIGRADRPAPSHIET